MDKQQQLDNLQYELRTEQQKLAAADQHKVAMITQQITDLEQEIEQDARLAEYSQREEEARAALEATVEENNNQIAYFLDNLTIDGMSMRDLFLNYTKEEQEASYNLLRAVVQQEMMRRDEVRIKENQTLKDQNEELQTRYDNLYDTSLEQRNQINDISQKRDAAVGQLEEATAEIERLKKHNDDLQVQLAVGAKNAPKVIDVTNSLEEYKKAKQKAEEAKPAIYYIQPMDNRGANFSAKLAETDEVITFNYLERGKYREVTAEQADQFRRAAEEQKRANEDLAQPGGVEEADVVELPTQFQTEEDSTDGVAKGNASEQVAGKTIEERLTALEAMVFGKGEVA
ncbi:hypothetical protein A7311_01090 [Paenibacillus polymyxa]|uniref:hypothetical protein n=1 Tax=Paenibacillus polymyxa TaxID=1406 RepID=UPI00083DFBF6|nr:hypothetical protein [Paenibacillus polymyxa]ODB56951.1 hypothetical protein A7311_01090 [Paenibacillus polymyxa]